MKNKVLIVLSIIMCIVLAGCNTKTIDATELAEALATNGTFTEELYAVSADITEKRYALTDDEVEECAAYAGTKAVVDEVVVFKAKDVDAVKTKVQQHISAQEESYTSYRPDEVPKLQDSVLVVSGDYVILCVSEDSSSAKTIIDEYIK